MRRFYLPPQECQSDRLTLTGAEARHAAAVLRLRSGEDAAILDGEGREFSCRVEKVEQKRIQLKVLKTSLSPAPACRITLVQAIPKGKILESIIQKATELGAWRIIPLLSERVTAHLDGESVERKADKWRQTAVEAIKQCGQRWLPKVEPPTTLPSLLARAGAHLDTATVPGAPIPSPHEVGRGLGRGVPLFVAMSRCIPRAETYDSALVGSLQDGARHPRDYFQNYEREHGRRPSTIVTWIGPEGDFSPGEVEAIQKSGAKPMTLGPLILRSETAALYTLSIINYELSSPEV
jgi:16S rRNA (uracil1498-N3)-methyltransferase